MAVRVIECKKFKEKNRVVNEELAKGRKVEVVGCLVYSSARPINNVKDFKRERCNTKFRVATTASDVCWAMCPSCGERSVSRLDGREAEYFREQLR